MGEGVFNIQSDDDEDNEGPGSLVITQKESTGGGKTKKPDPDTPIDNAVDIPLFHDADKRGLRTATYIKVIKQDDPGSGYKGNMPVTTTLDTIGKIIGNGLYTFIACNHRHQELRSKENIKVDIVNARALGLESKEEAKANDDILKLILDRQDKDTQRLIASLTLSTQDARAQSKEYTELVRTTTKESAERDRAFMQGQQSNMQQFFTSMMTAQNQMFQQNILMMQTSHKMTLDMIIATLERNNRDPNDMLKVFVSALAMGRDWGGDDNSPDWLKALGVGNEMLTNLLSLKSTNETNTGTKSEPKSDNKKPESKGKKEPPISKAELLEAIRLKKVLSERGIDFSGLVRQARESYEKTTSDDESAESSDETSEQNSEETEPEAT